jgi:hypothetical protein
LYHDASCSPGAAVARCEPIPGATTTAATATRDAAIPAVTAVARVKPAAAAAASAAERIVRHRPTHRAVPAVDPTRAAVDDAAPIGAATPAVAAVAVDVGCRKPTTAPTTGPGAGCVVDR